MLQKVEQSQDAFRLYQRGYRSPEAKIVVYEKDLWRRCLFEESVDPGQRDPDGGYTEPGSHFC